MLFLKCSLAKINLFENISKTVSFLLQNDASLNL